MPVLTWAIAFACSSEALAISPMKSTILLDFSTTVINEVAVSSAIFEPLATAETVCSIKFVVFLAASADFVAKLRTSSATTAKPFPAVPARAASTAALRARIFV
ncbi:hypothetical protein SDC9_185824 [bioreactor metagenome]|uniref:Uncharacterized protein n=1 Tax=bioreactor metagenome TaxID=1076179 RepID=A0A645HHU0_9ZZZZ